MHALIALLLFVWGHKENPQQTAVLQLQCSANDAFFLSASANDTYLMSLFLQEGHRVLITTTLYIFITRRYLCVIGALSLNELTLLWLHRKFSERNFLQAFLWNMLSADDCPVPGTTEFQHAVTITNGLA